ncbi:MAG: peptide-methionine (S)-S-oxide reductase [Paludibacteraceae bacterium]|nr:peptide-methionine (S)-S-oxide reductase [Paludibacteraceae bacterium]
MKHKHIYLAGGCFWGTEHYFKQIAGVVETEVGFANGHTEHPDGYCHLPKALFDFARKTKDKK